jgi:4-hydroxy-tetrahydrodipicolinate synthase
MLSRAQRKIRFEGPLTGLITPFGPDESVNLDVLRQEARFAIERCGATGVMVAAAEIQEATRLSREEKSACIAAVVDAVNGSVPVIAGASDTSTKGSIELARRAKDVGADAVMVMPTYGVSVKGTLSPPSIKEVTDFYRDLCDAVDIPVLLYNSTTLSTHLPVKALSQVFEHGNMVGMEETSLEYHVMAQVGMNLADHVSVLVRSHILLPALELGIHGAIMPVGFSRIGADLYGAYRQGDRQLALKLQKTLCRIPPEELSQKPAISFYKEALRQIGLNVGLPRRPVTLLDSSEKELVGRLLQEYGLTSFRLV